MSDTPSSLSASLPQQSSKRGFLIGAALAPFAVYGAAKANAQTSNPVLPDGHKVESVLTFQSVLDNPTPSKADFVQTQGFHHFGDGGGALYLRHSSQLYRDCFQSASGDWWSVVPNTNVINVRQFGAVGDGRSNDSAAVEQAVLAFRRANASVLYFPAGRYRISKPILHYDREDDRGGIRILGDGAEVTQFVLDGPIEEFLFLIKGDTSAYGKRHVRFVDFEDFGILGNGSDRQNLFSFTCADRINLRNVHAFDFVGTGIYGRQWWDSLCDIRFVKGGDDAAGAETAVIDLDFVFEEDIANSACNNLVFPETTQIEAYRWQAMRWGRSTRRCRFLGKIHAWIGRDYQVPAVHLQGATSNLFFGSSIAHSMKSPTFQRDLVVENTDYIPSHNRILACDFVNGVEFIGDVRANIVSNCVFRNSEQTAIVVDRGRDNIVRDNVANPDFPVVKAAKSRALAD
jgi:hypothetical protein